MYFTDYLKPRTFTPPTQNLWRVFVSPANGKGRAEITEYATRREAQEAMWAAQKAGRKASMRGYEIR